LFVKKSKKLVILSNISVWVKSPTDKLFYISQVIWENKCNAVNRLYCVRWPEQNW